MKLAADQIAQIKSWVSKRGFTHTDVQYEIIDHIASAIEEKMEGDPKLTLENAFEEVHRSFGVCGFLEIEEAIAKKLQNELWRSYLQAGKIIITSPKVLIPLVIVLIFHLIKEQFPLHIEQISQVSIISFAVISLICTGLIYKIKKHVSNYLSFKMAVGIIPSLIFIVLNLKLIWLKHISYSWGLLTLGITALCIYSIILGSQHMIKKAERLHQLYHG
jgi:hypothetical protein